MFGWFRTKSAKSTEIPTVPPTESQRVPHWSAHMWYRFVTYREDNTLSLGVDVMADGPDIVMVPSADAWDRSSPPFAQGRRDEILERLKDVKWNRELVWEVSDAASCSSHDPSSSVVPGSIESTPGGSYVEQLNLFEPDSPLSFDKVRGLWMEVEEQFAAGAHRSRHAIRFHRSPEQHVQIDLAACIQRNPNVTLHFK